MLQLLYLFILVPELINVCHAQEFSLLTNGSEATISLKNFNISDPDGESVEFTYTLEPKTSIRISVTDIPGNAYFVVVQAHTFYQNVTLSYQATNITNASSVTGRNIGLWKPVTLSTTNMFLQYGDAQGNTSLMIAVQAYGNKVPVPGGCNMEFEVETAPYIRTTYNSAIVKLELSPAAPPLTVSSWLNLDAVDTCLNKPEDYVMYRAYVPERDFTENQYYSALQRMMTLGRIKTFAHSVPYKASSLNPFRRIFAAYPGTGSAYTVVAKSSNVSAVYVPTFSYACEVGPRNNTCAQLSNAFSDIICVVILLLGIFMCFFSQKALSFQIFLLGFFAGLVCLTALEYFWSGNMFSSIAGGFGVGFLYVIVWSFCRDPYVAILLVTLTFGYFVAALAILPFIDLFDLTADKDFWLSYGCIILLTPVLLLHLAKKANIIATSVMGAYAIMVAIDYYIGSNLRYILFNSTRRATTPDFNWAVIDMPFQVNDVVLCVIWVIMALIGFGIQRCTTKGDEPFPAPTRSYTLYEPGEESSLLRR